MNTEAGAPERRRILSEAELLGASTSHGPIRRSDRFPNKSSENPVSGAPASTFATMFAQGLRANLPASSSFAALLQRGMSPKGKGVASLQIPAEVSENTQRAGEATRSVPAAAHALQVSESAGHEGSEGNPNKVFSACAVTVLAVTKNSRKPGVLRHNASVRMSAGVRSSVSWSGSGAGKSAEQSGNRISGKANGQYAVHSTF